MVASQGLAALFKDSGSAAAGSFKPFTHLINAQSVKQLCKTKGTQTSLITSCMLRRKLHRNVPCCEKPDQAPRRPMIGFHSADKVHKYCSHTSTETSDAFATKTDIEQLYVTDSANRA